MINSRCFFSVLAAGALGVSVWAAPSMAQRAVTPVLSAPASLAWVGCWEPMDALPGSGSTCIVPNHDLTALRLFEIAGGQATQTSTLQFDGSKQAVTDQGCTGWERARMAADGGRILLDAEVSCAGLPAQKRSGAFVITPRGEWLLVQGSGFSTVSNARVRLFRESANLASLPREVLEALSPVLGIAEATRADQARRKLGADDLRELAALDVAAPVIDVVVAAGFPAAFVLDPSGGAEVNAAPRELTSGLSNAQRSLYPSYYGFGYPSLSYYDSAMNTCGRQMWGMYDNAFCSRTSQWSRYGYGGFYGYGFGSGWIPGYGYGSGIVVVVRPTEVPAAGSGGRVVRGQGYSQGDGGGSMGGNTAQPRTRATPSEARGSSSAGSGSSAGSASSAGSTSSGSSSRTAKPRDP